MSSEVCQSVHVCDERERAGDTGHLRGEEDEHVEH